jgi:hypothetical protein
MSRVVVVCIFLILGAGSAEAQAKWWGTARECLASPGLIYEPPPSKQPCKVSADEEIVGLDAGGCFFMEIRQAPGGWAWVQRERGYPMIRNKKTGVWTGDAKCCNDVKDGQPFPPPPAPVAAVAPPPPGELRVEGTINHAGALTLNLDGKILAEYLTRQEPRKESRLPRCLDPRRTCGAVIAIAAGVTGGALLYKWWEDDEVVNTNTNINRIR